MVSLARTFGGRKAATVWEFVSSKNMISSLHRTMKTHPIITWHEGGTREKMFWKVFILAVQSPLGEPPVSVLDG